jgi:hypothetical protein
MLSYQHHFHAGNLADVQKHALLAWCLAYLTQKDKPLTYIETHAGRGLYDLASEYALKTGEAALGIERAEDWFPKDHPYRQRLNEVRASYGPTAYPGSPLIAALSTLSDRGEIRFDKASWAAGQFMGMIEHPVFFMPLVTGDEVQAVREPEQIAADAVETFLARYGT